MGRINYVRLIFSHLIFDIVQNLMFFNIFSQTDLVNYSLPLLEQIFSLCAWYGVWVDDFHKKSQILLQKFSFHFITFHFLNVITAPSTLKGSQNL